MNIDIKILKNISKLILKRIKYLGIHLTKDVKYLYTERQWWKKLKRTQVNGKIFRAHGWGGLILLKYITQSNLQSQCNPYQISNDTCHRNRTNNPKISTEPPKTLKSQSNLEKEEQSWRHHFFQILNCITKL